MDTISKEQLDVVQKEYIAKTKDSFTLTNDGFDFHYPRLYRDVNGDMVSGQYYNQDKTHIRIRLDGTPNQGLVILYHGGLVNNHPSSYSYSLNNGADGHYTTDILIVPKQSTMSFKLHLPPKDIDDETPEEKVWLDVHFEFVTV